MDENKRLSRGGLIWMSGGGGGGGGGGGKGGVRVGLSEADCIR